MIYILENNSLKTDHKRQCRVFIHTYVRIDALGANQDHNRFILIK